MSLTDLPAEEGVIPSDASVKSLPKAERDAVRCRLVEDALYRRARGYKVKLKKSFKIKGVEYDPETGKKVREGEDLKDGFEEVHIPAECNLGDDCGIHTVKAAAE